MKESHFKSGRRLDWCECAKKERGWLSHANTRTTPVGMSAEWVEMSGKKCIVLVKTLSYAHVTCIISGINIYGVRVSLPVLASASRACSAGSGTRLIRIAVVDAASIIHRL